MRTSFLSTSRWTFPDEVYVFTAPKGRSSRCARRDGGGLRYSVHTDIVNRWRRVPGQRGPVALRTELRSGDRVEIVTAATPSPILLGSIRAQGQGALQHPPLPEDDAV